MYAASGWEGVVVREMLIGRLVHQRASVDIYIHSTDDADHLTVESGSSTPSMGESSTRI